MGRGRPSRRKTTGQSQLNITNIIRVRKSKIVATYYSNGHNHVSYKIIGILFKMARFRIPNLYNGLCTANLHYYCGNDDAGG